MRSPLGVAVVVAALDLWWAVRGPLDEAEPHPERAAVTRTFARYGSSRAEAPVLSSGRTVTSDRSPVRPPPLL